MPEDKPKRNKGRVLKTAIGGLKPEIMDAGTLFGDWINERFGHVLNDPDHPKRGRLIHRIAGIGIEALEDGFSGHPYLDPVTDLISDVLEQATPGIWLESRAKPDGDTGTGGGTKTKAPSKPDPFAKAYNEAVKELRDIPYGIPEDERQIQEDEVKARLWRELDRIAAEEELNTLFKERVKELRGDEEKSFPPYHAKMPRPKLVEIAQLAGIETIPKDWNRKVIVEKIDEVRGVQPSPIDGFDEAFSGFTRPLGDLARGWLKKNKAAEAAGKEVAK